jgi:hypothetical protein
MGWFEIFAIGLTDEASTGRQRSRVGIYDKEGRRVHRKFKYFAQFLLGLLPLGGLSYAIFYFISANPVDSIIGKVFCGFLIIWLLYVLFSLPGEIKGLAKVLSTDDPETVIAELADQRGRHKL